jgi:hypothetical protein
VFECRPLTKLIHTDATLVWLGVPFQLALLEGDEPVVGRWRVRRHALWVRALILLDGFAETRRKDCRIGVGSMGRVWLWHCRGHGDAD